MAIVADTGVFVSAADTDEPRHDLCAALLRRHRVELLVTGPVVAETAWFIESRLGPSAEADFLRLITTGELRVIDLGVADYERCITLIETYADLGLGLVDASVVAVAERLSISTVATLNRRDFTVVRPTHTTAFELVP